MGGRDVGVKWTCIYHTNDSADQVDMVSKGKVERREQVNNGRVDEKVMINYDKKNRYDKLHF